MRRFKFFLLVACSSFAVGVMVSWSWHMLRGGTSNSGADSAANEVRPSVGQNSGRTYTRGPAGLAVQGSFITLYSSDGMAFTKWTVDCRSAEDATHKLQQAIRSASRIVSREVTYGKNADITGEKIVALFRVNGKNASASLLWTENDEFFQVEGASLHDILEYRKDFHR